MKMWDKNSETHPHLKIHNSQQPKLNFFEFYAFALGE